MVRMYDKKGIKVTNTSEHDNVDHLRRIISRSNEKCSTIQLEIMDVIQDIDALSKEEIKERLKKLL